MSANIALVLRLSVGILVAVCTIFVCWPWILENLKEWLENPLRKGFLIGFSRKIWLYFALPIFLVIAGSPPVLIAFLKTREFLPMTEFIKGGPYEFPGGVEIPIFPEVSWTLLCIAIGVILGTCASRILARLYNKFPVDTILLSILGLLASFIVVGFVDTRYYILIADFILAPVYYPWWIIGFVSITIVAGLCTELLLYNKEKVY